MTPDEAGEFPVDPPEGVTPEAAPEPAASGSRPVKGSQAARDRAAKAAATKARKKSARESRAARAPSSSEATQIRNLRADLADTARAAGGLMVAVTPIPGTYLVRTADDFADSLANLAAKNPKLLKSLQSGTSVMDYVAIGAWLAGLGLAVAVQFGQVQADGPAAKIYKLDEIAEEFYPPGEGDPDGHTAGPDDGLRYARPDLLGSDDEDPPVGVGAGSTL